MPSRYIAQAENSFSIFNAFIKVKHMNTFETSVVAFIFLQK